MKIEILDLRKFYLKEIIPYLLMASTLVFYGFPFKFPHNTFNWIQKYNLPSYTYPIFMILFLTSFILMLVSFFSSNLRIKHYLILEERAVLHQGKSYHFRDRINNTSSKESIIFHLKLIQFTSLAQNLKTQQYPCTSL